MRLRQLLLLALLPLLTACSSGEAVRSDQLKSEPTSNGAPETYPIYRRYSLTYNAAEDSATLFASFHVNGSFGSSVELVNPSRLSFLGAPVEKLDVSQESAFLLGLFLIPLFWLGSGVSYHAVDPAPLRAAYELFWTDPSGREVRDTVSVPALTARVETPVIADRTISLRRYGGSQSGITIRVQLRQNGHFVDSARVDSSGTAKFTSPDLVSGTADLVIEQESSVKLPAHGNLGGTAYLTYLSSPIEVSVQ